MALLKGLPSVHCHVHTSERPQPFWPFLVVRRLLFRTRHAPIAFTSEVGDRWTTFVPSSLDGLLTAPAPGRERHGSQPLIADIVSTLFTRAVVSRLEADERDS